MQYCCGVAEKIRTSLAAPYVLPLPHPQSAQTTVEHRCTASIGVVAFNHAVCPSDVMKWADATLYQAKEAGRNVVRFYREG